MKKPVSKEALRAAAQGVKGVLDGLGTRVTALESADAACLLAEDANSDLTPADAARNIVPGSAHAQTVGSIAKPWRAGYFDTLYATRVEGGNLGGSGVPLDGALGLEADFANNTFTRLNDAVGKEAGADFDAYAPYRRRRCILADDGTVLAYHGDDAYTETGTLVQAVTVNGTEYPLGTEAQVMVEQPQFYYRVEPVDIEAFTDSLGNAGHLLRKARYYVSASPRAGFKLHPAFVERGHINDCVYYSAFEAESDSADKMRSYAGYTPDYGIGATDWRTAAHARGSGWEIPLYQMLAAQSLLMAIEYGQFNIQETLGVGLGRGSSAKTGLTTGLGNASGTGTSGTISYRGVENPYGRCGIAQDGLNNYNGMWYVADHGYGDTLDGYTAIGLAVPSTSNYVSAFAYKADYDWMFIAGECAGSSALPVGDWQDSIPTGKYADTPLIALYNNPIDSSGSQMGPFNLAWDVFNDTYGVNSNSRLSFVSSKRDYPETEE